MNKFLILSLSIIFCISAEAKGGSHGHVHVHGYVKNDGTYVQPHMRTAPDAVKTNNFSYQGNVNPYTGKIGTNPDNSPNYGGKGQYIQQGYSGHEYSSSSSQSQPTIQAPILHNSKLVNDYLN